MTLKILGKGAEKMASTTKKGVFIKLFFREGRRDIRNWKSLKKKKKEIGSHWNYQMLIDDWAVKSGQTQMRRQKP